MKTNYSQQIFRYNNNSKISLILSYFLAYSTISLSAVLLLGGVVISILGAADELINYSDLFALCLVVVITLYIVFPYINQYSSIQVLETGMLVRVFTFINYWKFVPWNHVIGIETSPILDRWKNTIWVIKVNRLSIWHRILSFRYRVGGQDSVILSSDMSNRDELMKIIEYYLQLNPR